jgi:hypothetical protein
MAVEEQRFRIRRSIEEKLGVEEAAYLIEGRPPGGWDALVTKEYLDLRLDALRGELRTEIAGVRTELADSMADLRTELATVRTQLERQTTSMLRWLVPTVFAAIVVASVVN